MKIKQFYGMVLYLGMLTYIFPNQALAQLPAIDEVEVPRFELKTMFNELLPADVELLRDITYGQGGGRSLTLHIIKPKTKSKKPMPVIVWIHGGAWLVAVFPHYRDGDHLIFTFNAFALQGFVFPPMERFLIRSLWVMVSLRLSAVLN